VVDLPVRNERKGEYPCFVRDVNQKVRYAHSKLGGTQLPELMLLTSPEIIAAANEPTFRLPFPKLFLQALGVTGHRI
jgi:hypothetical protein